MGHSDPSTLTFDDHLEITELIHMYCAAVDGYDIEQLVNVFTPDGSMCFTSGERGMVIGHDALRRRLARVLSGFEATSHHVSNIRIAAVDDQSNTATGVTYLYAWHRFVDDRPDGWLWGRYHDQFEHGPAGWKLKVRVLRIVGEQNFAMPWNPAATGLRPNAVQSISQPPSTTE
ncbi:MAG: hypothetical protein ACI89G_000455 [Minisyncoccia bacterium]|jgi:hypothetical protein|tara:strand:- start:20 stop:541 length:522 start_codon:yes stop_codon:yes gene_type:complete